MVPLLLAFLAAQDVAPVVVEQPPQEQQQEQKQEAPASPASPAPSSAARVLRVAVMDLKHSEDLEPRVARVVADNLVLELRKLKGVSVISMDEVRGILAVEAQRQELGCAAEGASCLSELADALGADIVVEGSIATLEGTRAFAVRAVDHQRAAVLAQFEERLAKANGEELLAAVGPCVAKLFPDVPLRAGEQRGVSPEKARLLNPPPLPLWSTASVVAGALVAGAASITLGVLAQSEADSLQSALNAASAAQPLNGSDVLARSERVRSLADASNIALIVTATAALTAAVMSPFTDWRGAAEEDADEGAGAK